MSDGPLPRVQFIISGKFITLLLVALALLAGGYYWHNRQLQVQQHVAQTQERFKAPPYFVNRGASVVRSCSRCLDLGRLSPQTQWKVGTPTEIPETEQRWFLAVEDPPLPVTVSGVLMLPVYPALRDNPALGFNQSRVELVLFQNLERKYFIEQPAPPPPPPPPPADNTETPAAPTADPAAPVATTPETGKQ